LVLFGKIAEKALPTACATFATCCAAETGGEVDICAAECRELENTGGGALVP